MEKWGVSICGLLLDRSQKPPTTGVEETFRQYFISYKSMSFGRGPSRNLVFRNQESGR